MRTPGTWKATGVGSILGNGLVIAEGVEYQDAKLMAAAPELLDKLKAIHRSEHANNPCDCEVGKLIAKAEGKQV